MYMKFRLKKTHKQPAKIHRTCTNDIEYSSTRLASTNRTRCIINLRETEMKM